MISASIPSHSRIVCTLPAIGRCSGRHTTCEIVSSIANSADTLVPSALATLCRVESDGLTLLVSILEIRLTDSPVASAMSLSSSFLRRRSLRRWKPMATDSAGASATGSGARRGAGGDALLFSAARSTLRFVATFAISRPFRYAFERIVQQSRCDVLPRYGCRKKGAPPSHDSTVFLLGTRLTCNKTAASLQPRARLCIRGVRRRHEEEKMPARALVASVLLAFACLISTPPANAQAPAQEGILQK